MSGCQQVDTRRWRAANGEQASRFEDLAECGFGPLTSIGERRVYESGACMFQQGDHLDRFAIVAWGRFKESLVTQDGRSLILGLHGFGDPIGFADALGGGRRRASVLAVQQAGCLMLERERLLAFFAENPPLVGDLLARLTRNLVACTHCLVESVCDRVETRLARLFLDFAAHSERKPNGDQWISPRLTRYELAELAATTNETCCRVMSRWRRQRILVTSDDGFLVHDIGALREIASGECR